MSWIKDFFDRIFSRSSGGGHSPIIIEKPPEVYYKELAVYNCVNFIGNAVARSEIKTFENGKKVKKEDYFRLNISPNINENASFFWHKVISKMINDGKALVVDINDKLYVAESFTTTERPIIGNIYTDVALDGLALQRSFSTDDAYLFRLEDASVKKLIDGMNDDGEFHVVWPRGHDRRYKEIKSGWHKPSDLFYDVNRSVLIYWRP